MESATIERPLHLEGETEFYTGPTHGNRMTKIDAAVTSADNSSFPPILRQERTMYAIAFDLDTDILEKSYKNASFTNAYGDIRKLLANHGFGWQQGSVYFGNEKVNAVTCVLAVMDLTTTFPWFGPAVKDIRMLRIEEQNDLRPAIDDATKK